jgi:putative transposase
VARRPRLALAGELHLLMLRGHNDQPVFADDADRAAFIELLRESAARHQVAVHAYCLLVNEVHLLATPATAQALGQLVQSLGRRYVAAYNRRHGRRGTLWDGRFRSALVDADTLLLPATLYVEALPVAAGLASVAIDWPWSSAAHHAGLRRDSLLTDHQRYWLLGNTPFDREHAHTVALAEAQSGAFDRRFADATAKAGALGSPQYLERVAAAAQRPVQPRPRGRPPRTKTGKPVPV